MSEKAKLLRDFNEAFAKNDVNFILENVSDNIVWNLVGDRAIEEKEAVQIALQEMQHIKTLDMTITRIVTHGKSAAANGSMKIKEVSGKIKTFGFADFYEFDGFKDSKIRKMTSYVVPLKEEQKG